MSFADVVREAFEGSGGMGMQPDEKPAPQGVQQVPSIGRIVHYVLEDGPHKGEHRPAIIVKVWAEPGQEQPGTACQLQVFTDGNGQPEYNDGLPPVLWKTSRQQGDWPGSWHWPEFVPAQAR